MAGFLNTGLLNMGGVGGLLGSAPASNMTIAQLFNPASMRNQQVKRGLMNAGLALMNPDPKLPPSLGASIGRAGTGFVQGADQAKQDAINNGILGVQLSDLQRQQDERDRQTAALDAFKKSPEYAALPGPMKSFITAWPEQGLKAWIDAQAKKDPIKMGDDTLLDPNTYAPVWTRPGTENGGLLFDGKSVEGQALNYLIKTGSLTKDQAAQVAAGKPIAGADGSLHFLTPQDIVNAAKAQQSPQAPQGNVSQFDLMTQPGQGGLLNGTVQQYGIPLGPEKKTESQIKGEAIESGSSVAAQHLTAGATPDNPAPGADPAGTAWNSAMELWPSVGRWFMTGRGQASYDDLFNIAQNYTYALSGQQAPEAEVQRNLSLILPSAKDRPEAVAAKKQRLIGFINTIVSRAKGPGGSAQPIPAPQQPATAGGGWTTLPNGARIRQVQ